MAFRVLLYLGGAGVLAVFALLFYSIAVMGPPEPYFMPTRIDYYR